jgi:cell division GTPase FtsZ
MADEVLQQGVRGITDLMVMPGLINLDFADVRSVMGEMGKAMMGTGEGDRRQPRHRGGRKGDRQPAARRRLDEGRARRDHLDHRRRGHAPDGSR